MLSETIIINNYFMDIIFPWSKFFASYIYKKMKSHSEWLTNMAVSSG